MFQPIGNFDEALKRIAEHRDVRQGAAVTPDPHSQPRQMRTTRRPAVDDRDD